jgi:hypothetical protein
MLGVGVWSPPAPFVGAVTPPRVAESLGLNTANWGADTV